MGSSVPCAGAIVLDEHRRLLVVRRAHDPGRGLWSIPGGRCHPGEPARVACVREIAEETGLVIRVVRHAGSVTLPAPGGDRYEIDDFLCEVVSGELRAGDDAVDARWVSSRELAALDLVAGLVDALGEWRLLPG